MTKGAEVVSADGHGPKVLRTKEGLMMKLFRRKRLFSTAMWNPYAKRFARAAKRLQELGFVSVQMQMVRRVAELKRDMVVYEELEGEMLRAVVVDDVSREKWLVKLAEVMAKLHEQGVYFRAMHFGNVLVNVRGRNGAEEREMGFIDVSDTNFFARSLSAGMRARNFRPMTRYAGDREAVERFGVQRFVERYMDAAGMNERKCGKFARTLRGVHEMFAEVRANGAVAKTSAGVRA